MLYIDGFAGAGIYSGGQDGSPIVAVKAANDARNSSGSRWQAKVIRMVFVESDKDRHSKLESQLTRYRDQSNLSIQCINGDFSSAFKAIRAQHSEAFTSCMPLFAFLDPFGVKGVPFVDLREILSSGTSEVFLLLDCDGIERIRSAGDDAGYEKILNDVFGGSKWREILFTGDTKLNSRKILAAYRQQLHSDAGAKFTFSFEMRKNNGTASHHLLFATKHIKGLEKMKEAMRSVDKTFVFTDGKSEQQFLFAPDVPAVIARDAENYFNERLCGRELSYPDLLSWILQETPYMRAEKILDAIKVRQGVESITVGGKVVRFPGKAVRWSKVEKISFRDRLASPETGLFGQE
jgi:three-Cys-motif partner protein